MPFELVFTPSGRLQAVESAATEPFTLDATPGPAADGRLKKVFGAFASGQAQGLFALATERFEGPLAPSLAYWRTLTARYLTALCHTPQTAGPALHPIPAPTDAELASLLLGVPPMPGAEYVTQEALVGLWNDLDAWVRGEVAAAEGGLAGFLKERAPQWHQVGRVCFHLAENRRDPDCPFAFLATYAPSVSGSGRVQYQPLSEALRQYAGARDKQTLVKLLSPVHLASQKSPLAKELVDSGDIYQALAWMPRQAYRFLKDVPVLEESGVLVRLPDWWKKRPRPRVEVNIGGKKQGKFGLDAMLDFQVQLALGDQQLSQSELRALMAAEDGLVLLRGQWVEVDRQKLREALDHWKKVEEQARDGGISFIEGMRLLAGAPIGLADDGDADAERQWSFVHAGPWLGRVLADLRSPENLTQIELGDALRGTLRPYQESGLAWLWLLSNLRLGACLADDMGLGKTIQVLALLSALKKRGARGPRCWWCRRRSWPIGGPRWPASRPRSAPRSSIPRKRRKRNWPASRATPPRPWRPPTWP